ncbi:MAG TPA: hypothetical protein VGY55_19505 [Pirellulales bacterium]|jgi:hypothetical protein|nr:hypothetical protein [Pirellulales bacterium]
MKHIDDYAKQDTKSPVRSRSVGSPAFIALAAICAAVVPSATHAGTISYSVTMSSDYSLLLNPNNASVDKQVSQKSSTVVATANNNPVLDITNTSSTAVITDVKMTLTDPDSVFDALKVLQSPPGAMPQSPFTTNIWGGSTQSIDIKLPTALAPNQSLIFAVNLAPMGGFPNHSWDPGFENIFFQDPPTINTNANLMISYNDPTQAGDPAGTLTNALPALSSMTPLVTVTSLCCSTPSTSVLSTSFSTTPVPEPGSVVLMLLGSLPLGLPVWRKCRWAAAGQR